MAKTLYKSKTERKLCGVCGGVAEYLGVDVNIVRIAAIVSVFFSGLGVIAYIAAAFMLPEKDDNTQA